MSHEMIDGHLFIDGREAAWYEYAILSGPLPSDFVPSPDGQPAAIEEKKVGIDDIAVFLRSAGLTPLQAVEVSGRFEYDQDGHAVAPFSEIRELCQEIIGSGDFADDPPIEEIPDAPRALFSRWGPAAFAKLCAEARSLPDHWAAIKLIRTAPEHLLQEHRNACFCCHDTSLEVRQEYPELLPAAIGQGMSDRLAWASDGRWWASLPDSTVTSGRVENIEAMEDPRPVILQHLLERFGQTISHPFSVPAARPLTVAIDGEKRYSVHWTPGGYQSSFVTPTSQEWQNLPVPLASSYDDACTLLGAFLPRSATIFDRVVRVARPRIAQDLEEIQKTRDDSVMVTSPEEPTAESKIDAPDLPLTGQAYWREMRSRVNTLKGVRAKITIKARSGDREVPCIIYGRLAIHRSLSPGAKWAVSHSCGQTLADGLATKVAGKTLIAAMSPLLDVNPPFPSSALEEADRIILAFGNKEIPNSAGIFLNTH